MNRILSIAPSTDRPARTSILTVPNGPSTRGEPLRTESRRPARFARSREFPLRQQRHPHPRKQRPTRAVEPAHRPRQPYETGAARPRCDHIRMLCRRSESWGESSRASTERSPRCLQCLDDWIDGDRAAPDSVGTKVSFEVRSSPSARVLCWPISDRRSTVANRPPADVRLCGSSHSGMGRADRTRDATSRYANPAIAAGPVHEGLLR